MYEIRLLACCFPGEEHGKAPNPQTFSKQIDIALRLRPFVTSQVRLSTFLQSYSPSNYGTLKTETDIRKSCY